MKELTEAKAEAERGLQSLQEEFTRWRQSRGHRSERIPEALWNRAASLSDVLPITRVAKALRLSASALKARRSDQPTQQGKRASSARSAPSAFVELTSTTRSSAYDETTDALNVELERADGSRLRVRCAQASTLDALVQRFLA